MIVKRSGVALSLIAGTLLYSHTAFAQANPEPSVPGVDAKTLAEWAQNQRRSYDTSFQGTKALAKGNVREAEGLFRESLSLLGDNLQALIGLGEVLELQGKPKEAFQEYHKALYPTVKSGPIRDTILRMRYTLLLLDADTDPSSATRTRWDAWREAVGWYEDTLPGVSPTRDDPMRPPLDVHFDPDRIDAPGLRAVAHILLGLEQTKRMEYDLAIREFDQAIALQPKSAEGYFYRAYALNHTRDGFSRSQADYIKAAKLDSGAFRDAATRQIAR